MEKATDEASSTIPLMKVRANCGSAKPSDTYFAQFLTILKYKAVEKKLLQILESLGQEEIWFLFLIGLGGKNESDLEEEYEMCSHLTKDKLIQQLYNDPANETIVEDACYGYLEINANIALMAPFCIEIFKKVRVLTLYDI